MESKYKRVLLKISGEALAGEDKFGLNEEMLKKVALQVKEVHDMGVQVAVVVGGGNFWRGRTSKYGPGYSRLYRNAGNRHERHGPAGRL